MAPGAAIQVTIGSGQATVTVAGEIDMANADELRSAFADALASGCPAVSVDLGGIEFFGSEGVRCLIEARGAAEAASVELRVVDASRAVRVVLEITNQADLLAT